MQLQAARHIGIGIARPIEEVAGFLAEPRNFPAWASGLGRLLRAAGADTWLFETPMGEIAVRFTPANRFGVLDHTLVPRDGPPMYNPMRVFANAAGSEVVFTLFRRPGMTDAEFDRDADWVGRDLTALKALLERPCDHISGTP